MSSPKNWDKVKENDGWHEWINRHPTKKQSFPDNDKPIIRGRVVAVKRSKGHWEVVYGTPTKENSFSSENDARKFAVKFMRNHPKGSGAYAE